MANYGFLDRSFFCYMPSIGDLGGVLLKVLE
nr:MAG TPA: hypothetical protein [Herelleviridae sp.]